MDVAAAEELLLCWHAASADFTPNGRALQSEALQRSLWRHRDAIVDLVRRRQDLEELLEARRLALQPFARAAAVLVNGQNPVLISLPSPADGGRTFVQLRPADFRRAAELSGVTP